MAVEAGFFLLAPAGRLTPVRIGPDEKGAVLMAVGEMRELVLRERWPERPAGGKSAPSASRGIFAMTCGR